MSEQPNKRLVLIDGSGYIFRAFFALPPMTRPDGTPVNAVFGFANMVTSAIASFIATRATERYPIPHAPWPQ